MPTQRISPIGVGKLPGRQRPALWETTKEGEVRILAYFVSVEAMHSFLAHEPRVNQAEIGGTDE